MPRLLKTFAGGATVVIGIAVATAGFAQQGHGPSPQSPSTMPGAQQGDMMKMMPQMGQMMSGCIQMMKSHMQQPADPAPKSNPEQKG
jgi:hypothetical protein